MCPHFDIPTSRISLRIDLSEIAFEKRISRRRNTPRHIADRNAFLRRPLSMHVSSDKRKPQRFETVPSRSAVLDFKPSCRVIVIALNLERCAASYRGCHRRLFLTAKDVLPFFPSWCEKRAKQRQVSIGSSFFNFRLSRRCAVGRVRGMTRKKNAAERRRGPKRELKG